MMPPINMSIAVLSSESEITQSTLYSWRKHAKNQGLAVLGDGKNAEQWSSSNKFAVVIETASLNGAELAKYCRKKDKKRIKQLEVELRRKERALAETAALLVLRKTANAIWGEDEDE